MRFDIEQVLKDMAKAATNAVKDEAGDIKSSAIAILQAEKESLEELGAAKLKGQIDPKTFDREIEREKKVVQAELLTLDIMQKAMAQKAVNAALDVFVAALKRAL